MWDIPADQNAKGGVCVVLYVNTRRRNHKAPLWIFDQECSNVRERERKNGVIGKQFEVVRLKE